MNQIRRTSCTTVNVLDGESDLFVALVRCLLIKIRGLNRDPSKRYYHYLPPSLLLGRAS